MVTVIVPIFNEVRHIAQCLDSILAQDYPRSDMEVLMVDGMSTDGTREIVKDYAGRFAEVRMLDNPQRVTPVAMNVGIRAAKGDVIVRMDAHAIFPANYLSELVSNLTKLHADNVGGMCETLPLRDTIVCKSIASVLSSSFGMGNSRFRIGANQIMEVDTVPFGCFRRDIFDRIGMFDEALIRNQDDEFNGRIVKSGGKVYLLPHLVIKYYARDTEKKVFRMFFQYGLYKPLVNRKLGSPATIRQFFPPLFVAGLVVGLGLSFVSCSLRFVYLAVLVLYLLLATCYSLKSSKNPIRLFVQDWTYFVVHIGYGVGYLTGIVKMIFNIPSYVKANR